VQTCKNIVSLQRIRSRYASLPLWDRTVLPVTRHKWAHPALTPARQTGTRFTYPGGMEGWVDLGDRLHTERFTCPYKYRLLSRHSMVGSQTRNL